jgi:gas vesicle protein
MLKRKIPFILATAGITSIFIIAGFATALNLKSDVSEKIRICRNETCLRSSELINKENYNSESVIIDSKIEEQNIETNIIDLLTLILMGFIPLLGFIWWLINNQQEKRIAEFSILQTDAHKQLLSELLEKQEENAKSFTNEIKNLTAKLDVIGKTISDNKLEHLENVYKQEMRMLTIEKDLSTALDKVVSVEKYLNKASDFHIRS